MWLYGTCSAIHSLMSAVLKSAHIYVLIYIHIYIYKYIYIHTYTNICVQVGIAP